MANDIRCYLVHNVDNNGCTISIEVTNIQSNSVGELTPKRKFMTEYGHHLPPGVKFALQSVDFDGEIHYSGNLYRRFT